jgi:hypothetical protein
MQIDVIFDSNVKDAPDGFVYDRSGSGNDFISNVIYALAAA